MGGHPQGGAQQECQGHEGVVQTSLNHPGVDLNGSPEKKKKKGMKKISG